MVADLEKIFIGAIESTYTQDVEGLESLLEDFGSRFHPRHYLMLIVKWLLVRTGYCEMHEYVSKFLIIVHLQINLYGRKKGYLNAELSERRLESKERFCVEYMEALDIVDKGISHNRGRTLWELYSVRVFKLHRAFQLQSISADNFVRGLEGLLGMLAEVRQLRINMYHATGSLTTCPKPFRFRNASAITRRGRLRGTSSS